AVGQLLAELEEFLKILDRENLSSTALERKCLLSDLLQTYTKSNGCDEEYIYMNKVIFIKQQQGQEKPSSDGVPDHIYCLTNGDLGKHSPAPQKSLPDLPLPRIVKNIDRQQCPLPKTESPDGYYEEAEPYSTTTFDDGEAVSSSYESYDEEESSKGKCTTHQWPSTEASIELMKDARICAFLWRKKWLGQWAKQLCVIKDNRLLCYKSSKEQHAQLDVNLVGCSVVYKEKQMKKKEHKLKITPVNADDIVLGMQSKEQTEQWLKVIQEMSNIHPESISDGTQATQDTSRQSCTKTDLSERGSAASESGSSTDGHSESIDTKDVKKKSSTGLKLSTLMNLGRKKSSFLESPERTLLEPSGYLNVLVNSQWRSRWCQLKEGRLYFYQDKSKTKMIQQTVALEGCDIISDPSPEHLYSFRILHSEEEVAKLEAKSSDEMGHWLGLLLSESGSKTTPEELVYDYVDADRISSIVNAARTSLYLMQRKRSEPNTYIDSLPVAQNQSDDLYDDVDVSDQVVRFHEENLKEEVKPKEAEDRIYLDLIPAKSLFSNDKQSSTTPSSSPLLQRSSTNPVEETSTKDTNVGLEQEPLFQHTLDTEDFIPKTVIKIQTHQQKITFPQGDFNKKTPTNNPQPYKDYLSTSLIEAKLGKSRTEADIKIFSEEKERLEKEKENIRQELAQLRKEKREVKEAISTCTEKSTLSLLEEKLKQIDEDCKQKENIRVDLELELVEAKENLKKAESGPVMLGTTVEAFHFETPTSNVKATSLISSPETSPAVNSATALKNRPVSIMVAGKGTVLQKAK
uniref:Actin filament-associated protein 1-like 2 n=1 Tax=Latimeria chalumnae TaxID=7897 RepID=H3AZB3_LATCH